MNRIQTDGMLTPIPRQTLSDAVTDQLRRRILEGDWPAGHVIPSERVLCEALGVNRGAVREALRRLQEARLVQVRHGGPSRVLDYRLSGGLALLPELATRSGETDLTVIASVMEMRSALSTDVARLAARRGDAELAGSLAEAVAALRAARGDRERMADEVSRFWDRLVDSTGNVAYRLAYNALRETEQVHRQAFREVLAGELDDPEAYAALADAIRGGDSTRAERLASQLVQRGESTIRRALERWQ